MPELPEVETLRRELDKVLKNKKIKSAKVLWHKTVLPLSVAEFEKQIVGKTISSAKRQAKILIIDFTDSLALAVHLKMTGQLIFHSKTKEIVGGHPAPNDEKNLPNNHTRLILNFSDSSALYFNDMRKFGWTRLLDDSQLKNLTEDIGVEPLSKLFTAKFLFDLFQRYPKKTVKQILMDQALIAGIGNIYADEASFLAKLLPERRACSLSMGDATNLSAAVIKTLKLSIQKKGTSARNYRRSTGEPGGFVPYLNVYGRSGKPCKVCGTILKKIRHNGRGTVYCPNCQK